MATGADFGITGSGIAILTGGFGRFDSGAGIAGVAGLTTGAGSNVAGGVGRFLPRAGSGVGAVVAGSAGWPGGCVGMVGVFGSFPRFFMPSVGGAVGWPGLIKVVSAGAAGFPGFGVAASAGFTGCPGCGGVAAIGVPGWFGCGAGTGGVIGGLPRFFPASAVGVVGWPGFGSVASGGAAGLPGCADVAAFAGGAGWPGFTNVVPDDGAGCPGFGKVGSLGFPGRKGFSGGCAFVPAVLALPGGIPGNLAGALFAVVPGVSFAIFACNAAAFFGSGSPFQPLSNFGAAIVAATGGSAPGFFVRVTIGAVIARTPAVSCENFPSGVTGLFAVLRSMRTVGISSLPALPSALFTAKKFGPPL